MGRDLVHLMEGLPTSKIILVGHSLGGEVVMNAAQQIPERVHQIVFVDYAPRPRDEKRQYVRSVLANDYRVYGTEKEYQTVLQRRHPLVNPDLLKVIASSSLRSTGAGFIPRYDPALITPSVRPSAPERWAQEHQIWSDLLATTVPILIMRGIGSSVLSAAEARRITELNGSRVRLATIPSAGHSIHIDNPGYFLDILRALNQTGQIA